MHRIRISVLTVAALATAAAYAPHAHADIAGFGNFSGFTINQAWFDPNSGPSFPGDGSIRLTGPTGGQSRNIFANTPQDVSQFTASFRYRATPRSMNGASIGVALVVQSVAGGINGVYGNTGGVGYGGNSSFANSVAVPLLFNENAGSFTGIYTGGVAGGGLDPIGPVNLLSGNWISATLVYAGTMLSVTIRDTTTNQSYSNTYFVGSIASRLNGPTGYVGITAGTGSGFGGGTDQFVADLAYTVPSAPAAALFGVAGSLAARRRRPRR